jgi:hypothetical protein
MASGDQSQIGRRPTPSRFRLVQSSGQEAIVFTTRSMHRPAVLCVVACALLVAPAPVAAAQHADMHASFAQAAAKAQQQQQDLRSADTRDAAVSPRTQDLRHLQAGGSYTPGSNPAVSGRTVTAPGATAVDPAPRTLPGPPTWPVNPEPIKPAPVVHVSGSGSGLDWTLIGLGIAGSLLLVGGIAGLTRHSRRIARARLAA